MGRFELKVKCISLALNKKFMERHTIFSDLGWGDKQTAKIPVLLYKFL